MAQAVGMTISDKMKALNNSDLSFLQSKLNRLRAQIEQELSKLGDPNRVATGDDIKKAASQAGVSVDAFMQALEQAKRMGLLRK